MIKNRLSLLGGVIILTILPYWCAAAYVPQTTGVPGSPGATTTIDGLQLPPPEQSL